MENKHKIITKVHLHPQDVGEEVPGNPYFFIQNTEINYRISTSFEYLNKTLGLKINIIRNLEDIEEFDKIENEFQDYQFIDDTLKSNIINENILVNKIKVQRYQDQNEIVFLIKKISRFRGEASNSCTTVVYFGKNFSSLNKYLKYGKNKGEE